MEQARPRATHILIDEPGRRVLAVYAKGVKPIDLEVVATRLEADTGVCSQARQDFLDDANEQIPAIMLQFRDGDDVARAMQRLKELANPELSVAISELRIELLICRCSYLSTRLANILFATGFGPEDDEAFMLRYWAAIKQLPVAQLFSDEPQPPYKRLMDGLEHLLAGLGAYVTHLIIQPRPDPGPCSHPT